MHKLWAVMRREFNSRVRTRRFVVTTVLGPAFMAALVLLPALLAMRETSERTIMVLSASESDLGNTIATVLRMRAPENFTIRSHQTSAQQLAAARDSLIRLIDPADQGTVEGEPIDGLLVAPSEVLETDTLYYYGSNVSSPSVMRVVNSSVREALIAERLALSGVNLSVVQQASRPFELETEKVTEGRLTGESGESSFALAYAMSLILYMALLLYGVQVMGAVIEEKQNRINEVLVSSLRPVELLLGKVLGVGSAGLLQIAIWAGAFLLLSNFRVEIAGALGVPAETVRTIQIPGLPLDLLVVFLLFFLLGFFLYASAYAAVGASCNSLQETQQSSMPVTLLIVVGFFAVFSLINDPGGSMAQILTFVPFFAPLIVPVRYSLNPIPLPELLAAIAVTVLGVLAVAWFAGRIYRVGILAHGKKPKLKELLNWVRAG